MPSNTTTGSSPAFGPIAFGTGVPSHPIGPDAIGGKAAGLMAMSMLHLPVPPGVVLPIAAYRQFVEFGWTEQLDATLREGLDLLQRLTGRSLGDPNNPLLLSVRSGAAVSMPGMMDTFLNVGINDVVEAGFVRITGSAPHARDTRLRFVRSYAAVLSEGEIPADPTEQIVAATQAVFRSWNTQRAQAFRQREGIPEELGTAVILQAMVFGNWGPTSGTGVAFSRDPMTGAQGVTGEFLIDAQGNDVVDGIHSPIRLDAMAQQWPAVYEELVTAVQLLERHQADLVDVEFTVEQGRLYLLQTRRGRRSPVAAARMAVEMAEDPDFPLNQTEAVQRCRHLLTPPPPVATPLPEADANAHLDANATEHLVATGLPVSGGRGIGVLVTDVDDALSRHDAGESVVLVRPDTSPTDVAAISIASGLVAIGGGAFSHAAVVARSWALPAIVGASQLSIDAEGVAGNGRRVAVGEVVTVDGDTGILLAGAHPGESQEPSHLAVLRHWATLDLS